jgi:transposase
MAFWERCYFSATHSRLQAMIACHLPNGVTYFEHRISNAMAEGVNSKVATIQRRA